MDLDQMKQLGVENYYLDLTKYMSEFMDKNYPLTKEDMKAILNNQTTPNTENRQNIDRVMKAEIQKIIEKQAEENQQRIEALENGQDIEPFNIEIYKKQIFDYQQQLLEALYEYKNTKVSGLGSENCELLKDAINDGISGDAVESTLEDVINKTDEMGKTPKQVKEAIETIVDMKEKENTKIDESFTSDFVKENSEKITSALQEGISPKEVATTLVNSTNEATNRKGKKHLKFITKLIFKMKKKELKLSKEKENVQEKGKQKVLS